MWKFCIVASSQGSRGPGYIIRTVSRKNPGWLCPLGSNRFPERGIKIAGGRPLCFRHPQTYVVILCSVCK